MTVSIDNDNVTRRNGGMPDNFVRGRRPVGHKEKVIGVENPCGIAFGSGDGAGVVKQLAQLFHRVANVGAQHVLAKKLVEHLPHGRLEECDAA